MDREIPTPAIAPTADLSVDVAHPKGEMQVLKWSAGIAVAAILSGIGILYQEIGSLRRDVQDLRIEVREGSARAETRLNGVENRSDRVETRLDRESEPS